jgi:hypothetical protein
MVSAFYLNDRLERAALPVVPAIQIRNRSMLVAFAGPVGERTALVFKSGRPTYAIILLALSALFLCTTFLPFLYSILFPNEDLQRVVSALEDRASPPLDADSVVQEAKDAAGLLTRAIPVAYYSGMSARFHLNGSHAPERIKQSQVTCIAWFQKRPKPMVMAITLYENEGGQKAYGISEGNPVTLVRGYGLPILLFGAAFFLARRRKSNLATGPSAAVSQHGDPSLTENPRVRS